MRHFGYLRLEELDDRSQTITKLTSTCTGLRVGPTLPLVSVAPRLKPRRVISQLTMNVTMETYYILRPSVNTHKTPPVVYSCSTHLSPLIFISIPGELYGHSTFMQKSILRWYCSLCPPFWIFRNSNFYVWSVLHRQLASTCQISSKSVNSNCGGHMMFFILCFIMAAVCHHCARWTTHQEHSRVCIVTQTGLIWTVVSNFR